MIKKVFLDMDGVLTNFHKGVCDAFDYPYKLEEMRRYDFWQEWSRDVTRKDVNCICNQDFWAELEWHEEGKEIMNLVANAYGIENVFLLTCPMPNMGSWTGKKVWVGSMAPDYVKRLIVTHAPKKCFAASDTLLIDDKEENVDEFIKAGGQAILIPRPWNRLGRHKVIPHLAKQLDFYVSEQYLEKLPSVDRKMTSRLNQLDENILVEYDMTVFDKKPNQERAKAETPVSHKDYMSLSDAYDKHSRTLMAEKGEEYSIGNDFLCMENRLAGMTGDEPEKVSLIMAGKHITSLGIILEKQVPEEINLAKWDERIRDAMNLLKITAAFIHAKQNDFSLHLGKKKCPENAPPA